MSTILVVDDMAVFREPIAAALRMKGYQTVCAADGREALERVKTCRPDLVLLDVAMPEMDGLAVLQAMRADPALKAPPVILLTAVAERDYVIQAARLGARDYLLKSQFSLEELLARVARALQDVGAAAAAPGVPAAPEAHGAVAPAGAAPGSCAPAPALNDPAAVPDDPVQALRTLKPIMKRSDVLRQLESCGELRAFSPTVTNVLTITRNESCRVDQVAKAIKQDHAIALKILKLANSAVYNRTEPVNTLEKAVMRIGLGQIRQVMLNISVIDRYHGVKLCEGVSAGHFWEHAIGCGLIASEIAHTRSASEAEAAFTMGLVHDVGRIMYAEAFPEAYAEVVETARRLQLPLEQVESRLLLLNHADAMDRLLHAWKFPKELIDPIVFHHLSVGNIRRMAPRRLLEVATLALANRLCHALMLGSSGNEAIYATEAFCQALRLDPAVIQRIEETAREHTDELKLSLLASGNHEQWQDRREAISAALPGPLRPLFVSERPEIDAFRIFFSQIAERSAEAPNLAVVHLADAAERGRLSRALVDAETAAGTPGLPLLVLSPNAELSVEAVILTGRHHQSLPTPIVMSRLIKAIGRALESESARAAA